MECSVLLTDIIIIMNLIIIISLTLKVKTLREQ